MNRDDALAKIKKCLALSHSSEAHEAAAAMRQAQKLMAQFGLSERDVSLADVREASARAASPAVNAWEASLARVCADAFGCEMYSLVRGAYNEAGNYARQGFYVFVGVGTAPDVASYCFAVLLRQCSRARLAHVRRQPRQCKPATKTARGDAFAAGWVCGVRGLVERFAQPARDEQLLLDYMTSRHPDITARQPRDSSRSRGRLVDDGHRSRGYAAGRQAELHRGVGGVQQTSLTCPEKTL